MPTTMYCIWAMNFIADTTENFSRAPRFDKRGDVDVLQATCLNDMMKLGCADDEDEERAPPPISFHLALALYRVVRRRDARRRPQTPSCKSRL